LPQPQPCARRGPSRPSPCSGVYQWLSSDGKTLIQTNDTLDPNGVVYPVSQSWTELVPK
jgi:hypothetical protein